MGEHFFGTGCGKVSDARGKAIDNIARKHGASFVWAMMPEGPRYWFACPNQGAPWDGQVERAVLSAVEAAGLAPWGID